MIFRHFCFCPPLCHPDKGGIFSIMRLSNRSEKISPFGRDDSVFRYYLEKIKCVNSLSTKISEARISAPPATSFKRCTNLGEMRARSLLA